MNDSIDGWIVNFLPYIDNKPAPRAMRSVAGAIGAIEEEDRLESVAAQHR